MNVTLDSASLSGISAALTRANTELFKSYPGDDSRRQPVHSVYGGAHLFKAATSRKLSELSVKAFHDVAPDPAAMKNILGISAELAEKVYPRVLAKLKTEAVEDFRIDFEDGYGYRSDAEEDGHAQSSALEVVEGMTLRSLPPFVGIRVKALSEDLFARSVRTLDIFLTTLLDKTGGRIPDNFVVTLPKVAIPEQVSAFAQVLSQFEMKALLPAGVLKMELMVETPQAILGRTGQCMLPLLVRAAEGRCTGAHFGTYDYTAGCDITAAHQSMTHPACDFARSMMKVSLAGTGVHLSDGATNILPVGADTAVVQRAWKLGYEHVRHSLMNGFYQGWDLHPAQFPIRYAAVYAFFVEGMEAASHRLSSFMKRAAQATLLGDVFDDAASGQGLLNYFLRGLSCGAITESETAGSGLTPEEIRTRSFLRILNGRRK